MRGLNIDACLLSNSGIHRKLYDSLNFDSTSHGRGVHHINRITGLVIRTKLMILATFVSPRHTRHRVIHRHMKRKHFVRIFISAPLTVYRTHSPGNLCGGTHTNRLHGFAKVSSICRTPRSTRVRLGNRRLMAGLMRRLLSLLERGSVVES